MTTEIKGSTLTSQNKSKKPFIRVLAMVFAVAFVLSTAPLHAQSNGQSSKPKLAPIVLDEENSNPEAVAVVEKIYNNWIEENNYDGKLGEIRARYIPIAEEGTNHRFIFAILYDAPLGGCYARGCRTIILHTKGNNEWVGVFNAFVHTAWYDSTSNENKPANLIFSSNLDNSNPGVWMWNGIGYELVKRK